MELLKTLSQKYLKWEKKNKIYVVVGPCIGVTNYEVRKEFFNEFIKENKENEIFFSRAQEGKFLFDLRSYVNFKIKEFNIESLENIGLDTYAEKENFFSYRRSVHLGEKDYGRCISTINLINA